jgi:hypothetical protein
MKWAIGGREIESSSDATRTDAPLRTASSVSQRVNQINKMCSTPN